MATFLIDASMAASWCFPDERTTYSDAVLEATTQAVELVALRLWAYEIRHSVLTGVRRKRITSAHAEEFFDDLKSLGIRLTDPLSYDNLFTVAEQHDLTIYDAAYLDIALREAALLANFDKKLVRAPEQSGLAIFIP